MRVWLAPKTAGTIEMGLRRRVQGSRREAAFTFKAGLGDAPEGLRR
jgi:hypothetical protein